jgi:hypothetical protein
MKVPEWLKVWGPWIFRGLVLLLIVGMAYAWNESRNAKAELSKELERQKLVNQGLTVQLESSAWNLSAAEKKIFENDEAFAAEKKKLLDALGKKPKVVTVVQWVTAPVITAPWQSNDPPRECPKPDETGKAKDILVIEGDTGHVAVSEVTYETPEKNHVFVATASCWRDTPTPRLLWTSAISGPAPVALREKEELKFGWGAGLNLSATSEKFGIGPSVLFPPVEVFSLQWDTNAGAAFGTQGFVAFTITSGLRWR